MEATAPLLPEVVPLQTEFTPNNMQRYWFLKFQMKEKSEERLSSRRFLTFSFNILEADCDFFYYELSIKHKFDNFFFTTTSEEG